jgi:hypothetical protein
MNRPGNGRDPMAQVRKMVKPNAATIISQKTGLLLRHGQTVRNNIQLMMMFESPHKVFTMGEDNPPGPPEKGVGKNKISGPAIVCGTALTANIAAKAAAGQTQTGGACLMEVLMPISPASPANLRF